MLSAGTSICKSTSKDDKNSIHRFKPSPIQSNDFNDDEKRNEEKNEMDNFIPFSGYKKLYERQHKRRKKTSSSSSNLYVGTNSANSKQCKIEKTVFHIAENKQFANSANIGTNTKHLTESSDEIVHQLLDDLFIPEDVKSINHKEINLGYANNNINEKCKVIDNKLALSDTNKALKSLIAEKIDQVTIQLASQLKPSERRINNLAKANFNESGDDKSGTATTNNNVASSMHYLTSLSGQNLGHQQLNVLESFSENSLTILPSNWSKNCDFMFRIVQLKFSDEEFRIVTSAFQQSMSPSSYKIIQV